MGIKNSGTQYGVSFYDRGGRNHLFDLDDAVNLSYGRQRDAISAATVNLNVTQQLAQSKYLQLLEPGRHEMVIWREGVRVWEGPIIGPLGYTSSALQIAAQDVSYYLYRTVLHQAYSAAYPNIMNVTDYCGNIIQTELMRKEALDPAINVAQWMFVHNSAGEARTSSTNDAYSTTVWNVLDNAAANLGIDYTVIGRAIHLWDTSVSLMGQTAQATQADFQGDLTVSVYGSQLSTKSFITDGQGNFGQSTDIDPALAAYYGEWETIANPYDQDATTAPTQAELNSQAERNQAGRVPTPAVVRVPDNGAINLGGAFSFEDLVPGVWVPLLATTTIREFNQWQKIDNIGVSVDDNGEKITMTLSATSGQVNA